MAPRKFAVGDRVRLTAEDYSVQNPKDVYTISRMLPAEANIWQYRVKREGDGQERAASETQLVKVTPQVQTGRAHTEAQPELQRVRNVNALRRAQSAARRTDRDRR
jgi:hypothetical protein